MLDIPIIIETLIRLGVPEAWAPLLTDLLVIGAVLIPVLYAGWKFFLTVRARKKESFLSNRLEDYFYSSDIRSYVERYIPTKYQTEVPFDNWRDEFEREIDRKPLIPHLLKAVLTKESDDKYIIVLADSGMGKTTLLINLFAEYNKRKKNTFRNENFQIEYFPLAETRIFSEIEAIEGKKNTILLLDAFDEDPKATGRQEERLDEIIEVTKGFKKVLLTSRTQFFKTKEDEPLETKEFTFGNTNEKRKFLSFYLSYFEDEDVKAYLRKVYPGFQSRKRRKAKRIVDKSPSLMARPMLLSYIEDLNQTDQSFDFSYQIYEVLLEQWAIRESKKMKVQKDPEKQNAFRADLFQFSEEIALEIYEKQSVYGGLHIPITVLSDSNQTFLNNLSESSSEDDRQTRSFLSRDAPGNYRFSHRSILEYFLAKYLFEHPDLLDSFDLDSLENTQLFFRERVVELFHKMEGTYNTGGFRNKNLANLKVEEIDRVQKISLKQFKSQILKPEYLKSFKGLTAKGWFDLGLSLQKNQKNRLAILAYDEAIRLDAEDTDAYNNRGSAKASLKDYAGAIKDYDEAIRLDLEEPVTYHNRGNAKYSLKDYAGAIKDYDEAIRLDPDYTYAYHNRGNAKYSLKDYAGAIKDYDEAIRLDPEDKYAYNGRGYTYLKLNQFEQALSDFKQSASLDSKWYYPIQNQGHYHILQNNLPFALEFYEKALTLCEDASEFFEVMVEDFEDLEMAAKGISKERFDQILEILREEQEDA